MLMQITLFYIIVVFAAPFFSITKPNLLIAPLSTPQSYYLTVLLKELSSKYLSTGLRIDPFPRGDSRTCSVFLLNISMARSSSTVRPPLWGFPNCLVPVEIVCILLISPHPLCQLLSSMNTRNIGSVLWEYAQ